MQYKCVRGTVHFEVTSGKEIDDRVAEIASVMNRESVGGWEYDSMFPMTITKVPMRGMRGFMGGGSDMADGDYTIHVFVFRKP